MLLSRGIAGIQIPKVFPTKVNVEAEENDLLYRGNCVILNF